MGAFLNLWCYASGERWTCVRIIEDVMGGQLEINACSMRCIRNLAAAILDKRESIIDEMNENEEIK